MGSFTCASGQETLESDRYQTRFQLTKLLPNSASSTMEDIRIRHDEAFDATRAAFEELCAMVAAFEEEREERRAAAAERFHANHAKRRALKEKNQRLREKYLALLDKYNELAEEVKD